MDLGGDRDNTGKPTPGWGSPIRRAPSHKKGEGVPRKKLLGKDKY